MEKEEKSTTVSDGTDFLDLLRITDPQIFLVKY